MAKCPDCFITSFETLRDNYSFTGTGFTGKLNFELKLNSLVKEFDNYVCYKSIAKYILSLLVLDKDIHKLITLTTMEENYSREICI